MSLGKKKKQKQKNRTPAGGGGEVGERVRGGGRNPNPKQVTSLGRVTATFRVHLADPTTEGEIMI